jgi:shikimate kinase
MHIFLIGFMGCGKSTVSKKLANKLNLKFYDLDEIIENTFSNSISEIFTNHGEKIFRLREHKVLMDFIKSLNSKQQSAVISTGGGTPCYHKNMELMNNNGITVYLKMPPNALFTRLIKSKANRPLLKNLEENELMHFIKNKIIEREPFYLKSKITVNAVSIDINALKVLIEKE